MYLCVCVPICDEKLVHKIDDDEDGGGSGDGSGDDENYNGWFFEDMNRVKS